MTLLALLFACTTSSSDKESSTDSPLVDSTSGASDTTDTDIVEPVDSAEDTGSTPTGDTGTSATGDSSATGTTATTGDTGTTLIDTGPPGPPTLNASCASGGPDTFSEPYPTRPELFLLGVYEPAVGNVITVEIDRPGDVILALTSYESVQWDLVITAGTNVTDIILSGYDPVLVTGAPVTANIANRSPYNAGWLGTAFSTTGAYYSSSTLAAIDAAEALTGASLSGYAGCYQAGSFIIR